MSKQMLGLGLLALVVVMLINLPALAADLGANFAELKSTLGRAADKSALDPVAAENALTQAKRLYLDAFAPAVAAEPNLARDIDDAFTLAGTAISKKDAADFRVQSQTVQKKILTFALGRVVNDVGNPDRVKDTEPWFNLLTGQLHLTAKNSAFVAEYNEVLEKPARARKESRGIIDGLVAKFLDKAGEEAVEAAELAGNRVEALEKSTEGLLYYEAIADRLRRKNSSEAIAIGGLLMGMRSAADSGNADGVRDMSSAVQEEIKEISGHTSTAVDATKIGAVTSVLRAAEKQARAGNRGEAKRLVSEAWDGFVEVETGIRQADPGAYVAIESIFARVRGVPGADKIAELAKLFDSLKLGKKSAGRQPVSQTILTGWESIQPIVFVLLALMGLYPLYLIRKTFGWSHRAWRNIGIFIILLILPVFMEAVGRLGVEMRIPWLQSFSFMVNEWAKIVWTIVIFLAFAFAIDGLRQFCRQFGIKAFGVREEEPIAPGTPEQPAS